jgi:hypothetical protein
VNDIQKWADFLISAVRYEELSNRFQITHLKVHSDEGIKVSGGVTRTREEVIAAMSMGKIFMTIFKDTKGDWQKGREVFLKRENGVYIITDDNKAGIDLLKDVQEF